MTKKEVGELLISSMLKGFSKRLGSHC